MIRCILIEDEPQSAERLKLLLERDFPKDVKLEGWFQTASSAETYLKDNKPDLVFFDVEVGSQNAFDILKRLGQVDFKIIFTTAHEEYALQAIKHSALDYLLKPVDANELAQAVAKAMKMDQNEDSAKIQGLLNYLKNQRAPERIALPAQLGTEYIEIADIIRCQADVNYTHVFLKGGRKLTVARTLKDFEAQLTPSGFCRVHNTHLVNLREVRFYQRGKGGYLILKDGTEEEDASRRKEELVKSLSQL